MDDIVCSLCGNRAACPSVFQLGIVEVNASHSHSQVVMLKKITAALFDKSLVKSKLDQVIQKELRATKREEVGLQVIAQTFGCSCFNPNSVQIPNAGFFIRILT